ncbi:MAG: 16S rRNA (guanine(966)-N(2))-methyltransferase RsmD [Bacteroidales bacterium]|nr:16S rRNA (guanine(966)-N(2))-methyltransferase RsmD [Bacteroidales bacterium]
MRIISGKYKGRIISPPKNFKARPTTDRARESLFNILSNTIDFDKINVLDLFSGTGSVGFEFASRGAKYVEMIELNFKHFKHLKDTIKLMSIDNIKVIRADFFHYIRKKKNSFDIVFADPPFDMENFETVPELILNSNLLSKNGLLIIEHSKSFNFKTIEGFTEQRNYGGVNFSFFNK